LLPYYGAVLASIEKILNKSPETRRETAGLRRSSYLRREIGEELSYEVSLAEAQDGAPESWRTKSFSINVAGGIPRRTVARIYFGGGEKIYGGGFLAQGNGNTAEVLTVLDALLRYAKTTTALRRALDNNPSAPYELSPAAIFVDGYDGDERLRISEQLACFGSVPAEEAFLELIFDAESDYSVNLMSTFDDGDYDEDEYGYSPEREDAEDRLRAEIEFYDGAWREHGGAFRFSRAQVRTLLDNPYPLEHFYFKPRMSMKEFYEKWPGLSTKDFSYDVEDYDAGDLRRLLGGLVLKTFHRSIGSHELNGYTQEPNFEQRITARRHPER
jgi:hypothetical protein